MNVAGGESRNLAGQDLHLVKIRIERCLQNYMNKREVMHALSIQDNIEPVYTELIWQRLEKENPEFFKAYYLKLLGKDQITEFNRLLSEQVELMHQIGSSGIASMLSSNASHVSPSEDTAQHILASSAAQNARPLKTDDMQQGNMFLNCGPSIQPCGPGTVDGSVNGRNIDVSPNLYLSHNSNVGLGPVMNGKIVEREGGFAAGISCFNFSPPPNNFLESRRLMGDASVSSFSSVDSNAQHINEALLNGGGGASSLGFLPQIPQSFNIPDLAADLTTGPDLLESYCRPPFLTTDNNFGDPHGDVESLDPETNNFRYHCFGGA